jgi:hypothetical protein
VSSPADVDNGKGKRLVEWGVGVRDPNDPPAVAQRLVKRAAEQDRDIFGGVVRIDVEVAVDPDGQIKDTVPRKGIEEVID